MKSAFLWVLNRLWPWCPSGLPHRITLGLVTNALGRSYCWHRDCIKANIADCEQNCPEWHHADASERSRKAAKRAAQAQAKGE